MSSKTLLHRLHADCRGAIAPVMILAFIFFGFMVVMILNTGQAVGDKVRVQNGADTAAMIQGDWTARYLNTMSMNNVALTQSFTAMVTSGTTAFVVTKFGVKAAKTGIDIMIRGNEVCAGAGPFYEICILPFVLKALPAGIAVAYSVAYLSKYDPYGGAAVGRGTVAALNRMNDRLVESLPDRIRRVATGVLELDDMDRFFFFPPCPAATAGCGGDRSMQGSSLPVDLDQVTRGLAAADLCNAAEHGSNGSSRLNFKRLGYADDTGPYTGGGSSSNPHVRDYISKETEIAGISLGRALQLYKWAYPYPEPWWGTSSSSLYDEDQSEDENDFTRTMNDFWPAACVAAAGVAALGGGIGDIIGGSLPRPYQLAGLAGTAANLAGLAGGSFSAGGPLGKISVACPFQNFHFLAYAARTTHHRISASIYESALPRDYAYGQACVYNPNSFDLYTQDWQSKMMPAKHMDHLDVVLNELDARAPDEFRELVDALKRAGNAAAFRVVNVH